MLTLSEMRASSSRRAFGVICFTSAARDWGYDLCIAPAPGLLIRRSQMTAIARVLARAFPNTSFSTTSVDTGVLKLLALFCGAGLLVSLLLIIRGFDIGADFF
jgi:hypothetical protein